MSDHPQSTPEVPRPPSETMLRKTWSWRFDREEDVAGSFDTLGALILDACQEGNLWGETRGLGVVRGNLYAAAQDLDSLAAYLGEVAAMPQSYSVNREELALCHRAHAWAGRLREFLGEIREAIGEGG